MPCVKFVCIIFVLTNEVEVKTWIERLIFKKF